MKIVLILLSLCSMVFSQIKAEERTKIAVYKFESDALTASQTLEISKFLTDELRNYPDYNVMDWSNVGKVLGFVEEQNVLGDLSSQKNKAQCSSDRCYAELGNRLGVEQMMVGSVSKIGNRFLVNVSLQDVEEVKVLGTAKSQIKGDLGDILDSLPSMVAQVLNKSLSDRVIATRNQQAKSSAEAVVSSQKSQASSHHTLRSWVRWSSFGVAILGCGYYYWQNQQVGKAKTDYDSVQKGAPASEFDRAFEKVTTAETQRDIGLIVGGVGLTSFALSFAF
jgi:hypothetical protein